MRLLNYLIKIQSYFFILKWQLAKPFIILRKIRRADSSMDVQFTLQSSEEASSLAGGFNSKTPMHLLMEDEQKYLAYLEERIELQSFYPPHVVSMKLEHYFEED